MEFIIELILELLLEGGEEICANKKISKWIRYPILFFIMLFFSAVILLIIFVGIKVIKNNIIVGIILIAIGLLMLICAIHKFRKVYLKKKD